jgi:hypothetical protein
VGLLNPHLDDAAFAEIWADTRAGDTAAAHHAETHLRACADCRTRYSAFCGWLEGIRTDAIAEADEAFSAERLAIQQALVGRRLEALEHPGRVIAFPRFTRPTAAQPHGRQRWIAAAAAAGLVAGVGLGQFFNGAGGRPADPLNLPQQMARGTITIAERPDVSDEAFFDRSELEPSQVRVPDSLQYLNDITPGARDYDPR